MKLSDANISKLILNVYSDNRAYECDYTASPRPFHSIALMLRGSGELYYRGQSVPVGCGDVFLIPQNCTYASRWIPENGGVSMFSMHFSFEKQLSDFAENFYPVQKYRAENFNGLIEKYEKLRGLLADERGAAASAGCFYKLIGDILPKFDCEKRIANERVQPAVDYIAENCTKELSVGELAGLCYLSEPRFFALFKAATGLAPIAYKNTVRLKKAANYLISRPDKSVEAVAEALNYSSPAYFIREFRKAFGATPAVYRKTAVEAKL